MPQTMASAGSKIEIGPYLQPTYALNPRTVQEWEQGRAQPDVAVRAYLTVIRANPRAVEKALAGEP